MINCSCSEKAETEEMVIDMKKRTGKMLLLFILCVSIFLSVTGRAEAAGTVVRNHTFTTEEEMNRKTGGKTQDWMPVYLTKVEGYFWNFATVKERESCEISLNLASNAYQNLEMFLDNGYLLEYGELKDFCEDYKERAGRADAYYLILKDCLNNPYLLHKPEAVVTGTTYNGRDYSAVFDADYYYTHNPDLQKSIGNNPAELLRHFVECGINEGRQGNAAFRVSDYMQEVDREVSLQRIYAGMPGAGSVSGRYSYSFANYYGKYLKHYEYLSLFSDMEQEEEY